MIDGSTLSAIRRRLGAELAPPGAFLSAAARGARSRGLARRLAGRAARRVRRCLRRARRRRIVRRGTRHDAPARTRGARSRCARARCRWTVDRVARRALRRGPRLRSAAVVRARARGRALLRHPHLRGARQRPRAARRRNRDVDRAAQSRRNRSIRTGSTISSPAGSPPGSRWPPPWSRKRGRKRASRPTVAARAQRAGTVRICREQPDGLQRETIFVHDLWLPAGFVPAGQDGEVAGHRLVPLSEVATLIANDDGPDVVTADAALVMLDCLLRHGAIAPDAPDYVALAALRQPPDPFAPAAEA